MIKVFISSLDKKVNKNLTLSFPVAMKRIENYVCKNIDPTFPRDEFKVWYDSDTNKPFKHNKITYYWNNPLDF